MKSRIAGVANARNVESEAEKAVNKIIEVILSLPSLRSPTN